jgi:hypothetical protein
MATFNPVPSEVLHTALENAGFVKHVQGKEVVYDLANHLEGSLSVRVYTSAKVGAGQVMSCGKDAIRSVLLHTDSSGNTCCVKKGKRVNRAGATEAIVGRMLERARELYRFANHVSVEPTCKSCGAPCYPGSSKCVTYCWKQKAA